MGLRSLAAMDRQQRAAHHSPGCARHVRRVMPLVADFSNAKSIEVTSSPVSLRVYGKHALLSNADVPPQSDAATSP